MLFTEKSQNYIIPNTDGDILDTSYFELDSFGFVGSSKFDENGLKVKTS